jgi:uncharacterized repeat protein (TIGR02543 family)
MKRRILNVLVCLCMLLVVSLLSTACGSKTYKMTFETNGGTLTETVKEYTKDKEVGDLPTPTYAGYDFIGWFEDKDFKVQLSSSSKYNKDLTVYAKYELSTLTLTLDPNGGEGEQQKITGKMGDKITLPTCTFTKTGNEFSSWSVSKNADEDAKSYSDEDEFIFGSESLTLYADWAKEHYNIAYVPYDGTPSAGSLPTGYGTVYYGDKLPTLVKTYYDYVGWTETDLEESHGDFTTMTTCPDFGSTGVFVTLYCDFVYHPYKLTVSGSSAVPNLYVHYESNKIYKDEEFKTIFSESDIVNEISIGYHFYGLRFATSQFSGDVEAAGRLLTNYYVLRPSVSVQTKNGDVNLTDASSSWVYDGDIAIYLLDSEPNVSTLNIIDGGSKILTTYAFYNNSIIRVTNGELDVYFSTNHLKTTLYTKAGYTFSYLAYNGTNIYDIANEKFIVSALSATINGKSVEIIKNSKWVSTSSITMDLDAVFTPNTYNIIYNANGGTGSVETMKVTYNASITLNSGATLTAPTNYVLYDWNTKADGSGKSFTPSEVFTYAYTNDLTLYAIYVGKPFSITYHINYDSLETTKTLTYNYNDKILFVSASDCGFDRVGYTISSWNSASDGSGAITLNNTSSLTYTYENDISLYAIWKIESYVLSVVKSYDDMQIVGLEVTYNSPSIKLRSTGSEFGEDITEMQQDNFSFDGIYTDKNYDKMIIDTNGTFVANLADFITSSAWIKDVGDDGATLIVYAKYTGTAITISYANDKAYGGVDETVTTVSGGSLTVTRNLNYFDDVSDCTISSFALPTATGYKFEGFFTNDGIQVYDTKGAFVLGTTVISSDKKLIYTGGATLVLYAHFSVVA